VDSSNPFSLDGKVALVTGGGRGIGAGIARSFADAGAAVALVSRTQEQVDAVAAEINRAGGRAVALPTDLNDIDALESLLERTTGEFGGLDILVNCAGGGNMWRPFLDETAKEIDKEFHFHVTVPFELVHRAVPHLLKRSGASIINIVSSAIRMPTRGHLAYDAAKGAFHYATRSMAASLGPKIRVNSINPGIIETEAMKAVIATHKSVLEQLVGRVRMRRLGTPEDVGRAAVFLASPAASYITGVALDVDGGAVGEMNAMFPDL
jgi:7-alpha-hydroxysteroid dehydrogenase